MVTFFYAPSLIRIILARSPPSTVGRNNRNMRTARILSICILLLSIMPFASLFFFLSTVQNNPELLREVLQVAFGRSFPATTRGDDGSNGEDTTIQDYNEKITQLIWDILSPRYNHFHNPRQLPYPPPRVADALNHHAAFTMNGGEEGDIPTLKTQIPALLTIMLPTIVSIVLGILIPLVSLLHMLWNKRTRATKKKQQRQVLLDALSKNQITLEEDHKFRLDSHRDTETKEREEVFEWRIPISRSTPPATEDDDRRSRNWKQATSDSDYSLSLHHRIISDSCTICLSPYEIGDTVVWSENPECIHVFHESCMLSWLMKRPNRRRQLKPCPNCRQAFTKAPASAT